MSELPTPALAPVPVAPALVPLAPLAPGPADPATGPRAPRAAALAGAARPGGAAASDADDVDLDAALRAAMAVGASDLHLTVGAPPTVRRDGSLRPLEGYPVLAADSLRRSVFATLTQRQRDRFEADLELDFAYSLGGAARFRVNLYQQRSSVGAVFRVIPHEITPLEQLGVPAVVGNFAGLPRGLVLVTGPTGSGKSTTLAAILDLANRTRHDHIVTVEDPIEFLHRHKGCLVNQREVGADTQSFTSALRHALRQDPDIILVGELRDLETISVALTAAETGHLVFATLHTQDAAQTVDRIVDVFPAEQHGQIRTQLAGALQGIVSQTLCRTATGRGRVVATEVLVATPAIRNLIREGRTHQLYSVMQAGGQFGMHTLDQDLAQLVVSGRITYEDGLDRCHHVEDYTRLTNRTGSGRASGSAPAPDPDLGTDLGTDAFGAPVGLGSFGGGL
ncbi:type IV pilus twitching motility protein PilT [Cellulomonas endophytica]|uniref:type IV pilus twitching motility protein PilT n=1 Tax=Cellulomonas endophytica TaxID=2494735 RepID=UPI0023EA6C6B|nr:type IV pilus twitching motility protein PilT [Cellulomonas endophytica]